MGIQVGLVGICFPTVITLERLLPCMYVCLYVPVTQKVHKNPCHTYYNSVWTAVNAYFGKCRFMYGLVVTYVTHVIIFSCVYLFMHSKFLQLFKLFMAHITLTRMLLTMDQSMVLQKSPWWEHLATRFTCYGPQHGASEESVTGTSCHTFHKLFRLSLFLLSHWHYHEL